MAQKNCNLDRNFELHLSSFFFIAKKKTTSNYEEKLKKEDLALFFTEMVDELWRFFEGHQTLPSFNERTIANRKGL